MHGLVCCKKNIDVGLLLIRLGLGAVFFAHGVQKLQGLDGVIGFFGTLGLPPFFAYLVAGVETLGGLALIVGLWNHWAAKLLAIVMIGAILLVKGSKGFLGGYEFDLMLLFALSGILFTGAGKYSLDEKMKKQ